MIAESRIPANQTVENLMGTDVFALRGPNRGLMVCVWWNVILLVLSVAALPFDNRLIMGLNPWIKPIKFEISIIIYGLTVAVLLDLVCRRIAWPRTRAGISWGIGIAMLVENTIIAMQSLRGVRSHMNYTTLFNGLSFAVMGVFVAINTLLVGVLLVLYLVSRTGLPRAMTLGIQLGLLFVLAGSAEGVLMIVRYSAHTVGGPDGGPGTFFVNWSTGHGDLRVAHFFAMHALQIFPLAGWAISRTPIPQWAQSAAVVSFAALYSAGLWMLFTQAIAGRPLLG